MARYSIGALAVTAFAAFGFAVRDAHPATHTGPATVATASASTATSTLDQSDNSAAISPAPQYVAPTIQSAGS
jgi:hypothetical protein